MTDRECENDIVCDSCEEYIIERPTYREEWDCYMDDSGDSYQSIDDFLEQAKEIALYNQEFNVYICMGCVEMAYYARHGLPLRLRISRARLNLGRWLKRQQRRLKR